jgi:DNA-binding CsgD family transcriptional regulator
VFDRLPSGIVVVDGNGTVVFSNGAARRILESGDGLCERDGRLHACGREDDERLRRILAKAADPGGGHRAADCLRIASRSGQPHYIVTVTPLADAGPPATMEDGCALILISGPDRVRPPGLAQALQRGFGLTRAEARTASLVGYGLAPQDAAERLGISVATIHSELKSVYAKLDISRQNELAAAITALALLIP